MARIREYTQQTSVSGEVGGRRATAEDFGYGAQMQEFGNTMQSIAVSIRQNEERVELDDASVKVAQARQQWTESYLKRKQDMKPGDMSLAPTMRDEMNTYFEDMANNYTSDRAKKYIRMHGTTMTTDFFADGLRYQQHQAGVKAKADHSVREDTGMQVLYADPSQYASVKKSLQFDIENGVGAYAYLQNAPDRDKLLNTSVEKFAWAAAMKAAEDPAMRMKILGALSAGMTKQEKEAKAKAMHQAGASEKDVLEFLAGSGEAARFDDEDIKNLPEFVRDLTPQAQQQMISTMRQYQRQEDVVANRALQTEVKNQYAYMALTGQVPSNRLDRAMFKGDNAAFEEYNAVVTATQRLSGVWSTPYTAGLATVEALKPVEGDPDYAAKAKIYADTLKTFNARWKALADDHIGADLSTKFAPGTGGMTAISVDKPDQWVRELIIRAPQAKASSSMRNLPYKMLSDDEAKVMGQQFGLLDTNKQMRFLSQVGTQLDKDSIRVLMGQIAQGKQGIAAVGDLMYAYPGATQAGEQRDQTAEYILLGTKLMNRPKGGTAEDERGAYRQQMPTMREAFDVLGGMNDFKTVSPEFSVQLRNQMEVVMAHYVGKMTKAGVSDFTIKNHKSEFENSVKAVFGKPEKIGESKVIVPWGMPNAEFAEAVRQRVPMQWGTYSLRQPLTAPSNIYEVVQGGAIVGAIDVSKPVAPKDQGYGLRLDGTTKGKGYFGELRIPGTNDVATEYSIGVNIDGKDMDIPSLVPTLTKPEIEQVLQAAKNRSDVPDNVVKKAVAHARKRISQGKSPFADSSDGELPAQFQGVRTYSDRTGMGFYEQSNRELFEMIESNVRTNIEKMTEGLR
jgi:hypothetical protein